MRRPTTLAIAALACTLIAGAVIWLAQRAKPTTSTSVSTAQETRNGTELPVLETPGTSTRTGIDTPAAVARESQTVIHIVRRGALTPVAEAALTIGSSSKGESRVTTDATGSAQIATSALADSRVEVRAPDYCTATFSVPTEPAAAITFELIPSGKFAVHVRDMGGTPLQYRLVSVELDPNEVSLEIRDSLRRTWPLWGRKEWPSQTDAGGDVIVEGMPHGLKLSVECMNTRVTAQLDPQLALTPVEIVVDAERCITGHLVWSDGSPAYTLDHDWIGVNTLQTGGDRSFARAVVQRAGDFRLGPLPQGRTLWKIDYPGETPRCTTILDGPVDVGTIVLAQVFECTGRIVHGSNPELPIGRNLGFYVRQAGKVTTQHHIFSVDGSFSIRLPAGPATLTFYSHGGGRNMRAVDVVSPFKDLVVDADEFTGTIHMVNASFANDRALSVLLVPPTEGPPTFVEPRRTIRIDSEGDSTSMVPCSDGVCVMNVQPGIYDLFVRRGFDGKDVRRISRVTVVAGHECTVDAANLALAGLRVLTRDSDGQPISDLEVEAHFDATFRVTSIWHSAKTNDAGEASFPKLSPGLWIISPQGRGPSAPEAVMVTLVDAETRTITLTVDGFGSLRGTLTRGGEKADDVGITIRLVDAPMLGTVPTTKSDAQGGFAFDRVIAGRYELTTVQGKKAAPRRFTSRVVEVVAGRETRCDLNLDADLRPIVVRLDGQEFDDLDGGSVWTPDGRDTLQRRPEFGNRWCANLREGPCLFRFESRAFKRFEFEALASPVMFACEPTLDHTDGPLVVDLRGATIVVHSRDPRAEFPTARLVSVPPIGDVKSRTSSWPIAHEDSADERTFRCIPAGSVVTLQSDAISSGEPLVQTLTVGGESTQRVEWPPR